MKNMQVLCCCMRRFLAFSVQLFFVHALFTCMCEIFVSTTNSEISVRCCFIRKKILFRQKIRFGLIRNAISKTQIFFLTKKIIFLWLKKTFFSNPKLNLLKISDYKNNLNGPRTLQSTNFCRVFYMKLICNFKFLNTMW